MILFHLHGILGGGMKTTGKIGQVEVSERLNLLEIFVVFDGFQ